MDPISIALGLAKFVPDILRWFGNDNKADVAQKVINVASAVTGEADPEIALKKIQHNGALQIKLQETMRPVVIAQLHEDTKRLEAINATMRVEIQSDDKFKSYWRPMFGYIMAFSWGAMMLSICLAIYNDPKTAAGIINSFSALGMMWSVGLGVLGVQISARSGDKKLASGAPPVPGIAAAIAQRIKGSTK